MLWTCLCRTSLNTGKSLQSCRGFCRKTNITSRLPQSSKGFPPRGAGILLRTPLSSAGCPRAPSLTRCDTCKRLPSHHVFLQHCATRPKPRVTAGGTGTCGNACHKTPQILPCPRAKGALAAPGTEHPASSRGSPGERGGRQWHSQRPGTGTPPRSCRSRWSAQSALQRAAVTAERGKRHICNEAHPSQLPSWGCLSSSSSSLQVQVSTDCWSNPLPCKLPATSGSPLPLRQPCCSHKVHICTKEIFSADICGMGTHHPALLLPNALGNGHQKDRKRRDGAPGVLPIRIPKGAVH